MDEIRLGQARDRGLRAEELLNNSLLKECFDYLEQEYLKAWRLTKARETESREKLWQAIQIIGIIQEHLRIFMRDGRVANHDLNRMSEEAKRKNARES